MLRKISFVFVFIFFIGFISAVNISLEDKGISLNNIDSDSQERLENVLSNRNYVKTLIENNSTKVKINKDEVWIKVSVDLKASPEFEITEDMNFTRDERREFTEKRSAYFEDLINETLDDILGDNIQLSRRAPEGFQVWVNEEGLKKLSKKSNIESIVYSNETYSPYLNNVVSFINVDDAWSSGYTGEDVRVCMIDSGIDSSNLYVYGSVVDEYCYCDQLVGGCCPNGQSEDDSAEDEWGHGTEVAGIFISNHPTYKGISYNADLYVVKIFGEEGEGGHADDIADAIDWCIGKGVDIISMSLGRDNYLFGCPKDYDIEISSASALNIFLDAASGNSGNTNKISYPACNNQVVSVGSSTYSDLVSNFTNRNADLDLLAPEGFFFGPVMGGGIDYIGTPATSYSAPMVTGAAALLLQKNPNLEPDEILYKLQSKGVDVYDSETGLTFKRIDVQAALNDMCSCGTAVAGLCGASGGCEEGDRRYTRDCDPSGCQTESYCSSDPTCESGGGGIPDGVEPCDYQYEYPEDCPYSYDATDHDCYMSGNNFECELECSKEELSDWILYDSASGSGAGWKSDGVVECSDMYLDVPDEYEEIVIESYVGYDSSSGELNRVKWHVDSEGYSPLTSSCSSHTSSYSPAIPPSDCGASCLVESYVELFKGTSSCTDLCDNNIFNGCDDINYWIGCSAELSYNEYQTVYANQYCDVPYSSSVEIDDSILAGWDVICDVGVSGSESYPDRIRIKWYVNDELIESQNCDDGGSYDECDDDSGLAWGHSFIFDGSELKKDDEIYCRVRGYGEEGGYGAYVDSDVITVLNNAPTWASISLSEDEVEGGTPIIVTANSEDDDDEDLLSMYCCNGVECTPSLSSHDFTYIVGETTPYDLASVGYANETDGENMVRCRIYDGGDYSDIKSATYFVNNSLGDANPTTTLTSPADYSVDTDGSVTFGCSASDDFNLVNITLFGNWNGWHANETKSLTGISNSTTFTKVLPEGIYQWNCLTYDNSSQSSFASSNWTINFSIIPPPANDTYKFYHKNSLNENIAWFGSEGNLVLKGQCYSGGNCNSYGDNAIVFGNSTDNSVAYIDSDGNLCLEYGDCSDESLNCNSPTGNSFIVKDPSNVNVIYIDGRGELCLTGKLYQNSNP